MLAVGVRAKAYKLFESYLSDRVLFVASNGEVSEHVGIKSGVPQGAIWSPLDLFVNSPTVAGGSAEGVPLLR